MVTKILIITLTVLLIAGGLIGSLVPIIPGPLLVFLGAFIYAWYTGFTVITWGVIALFLALTLFAQALDYLASVLGAQRFGASRWGIVGTFLGGIIGFLAAGLLGIIIGPFIGAVGFEMVCGKGFQESLKVGFGTFIGFLGGTVGRVVITVMMIGIFLMQVIG